MRIEIDLDPKNPDFDSEPHKELGRLIRQVARAVEVGRVSNPLIDKQGNTVGWFKATPERAENRHDDD